MMYNLAYLMQILLQCFPVVHVGSKTGFVSIEGRVPLSAKGGGGGGKGGGGISVKYAANN